MSQTTAKIKYKHRLRVALVNILFALLNKLSLRSAHRIGAFLSWLVILLPNRNRRITYANIRLCFPGLSTSEQNKLARQSLVETGKTITETPAMWLWPGDKTLQLIQHIEGAELLQQAHDQNKGVIIAFPHLGNWELVSLYCSSRYPMTTLYKPPQLIQLDEMVRHGREKLGARLYPTDNTGVRALLSALKKGEMVGVLPDQEPRFGNGVFAPFFNIQAYSPTLISKLASKTGALVIFAFAKRLPAGKGYELVFTRADNEAIQSELTNSVTVINQGVEQCIRFCPEQYQWSYHRFRTRPEGEKSLY